MTTSDQNYQKNTRNLEDALLRMQTSHGSAKMLGIISNSDKISQKLLQSGIYSMIIEVGQEKDEKKNTVNDLDNTQFDQLLDSKKFDVIYLGNVLHYAKDPSRILNQLSFHLNENGILIGYSHNISHVSARVCLLDGDFNYEKIGLIEDALHHYSLDSMLILLNSISYSLNSLYRIKDEADIKRTDLFHYKFPSDLLESILADPESETLYYIFEAAPKSKVDKFARKWASQFSRNLVTERLDSIIESYKKIISEKSSIIDYYQKVIKDKQIGIQKIEEQNTDVNSDDDKESHLLQVIEQKDILAKGLMESIEQKDSYIKDLTESVTEKDLYIKDMKKSIEEKDSYIKDMKKSIEEKDKKIEDLQKILLARSNKLVKIHNSFTWKFLRKFDKIRQK